MQMQEENMIQMYTLFCKLIGKQEEGGRDYLYSQNNGDADDITFTVKCKKTEKYYRRSKSWWG